MLKHKRLPQLFLLLASFGGQLLAAGDIRVTSEDALKAATEKPKPEYSAIARQMRVSGAVEVDVAIAPDGSVAEVKVLSGNPLLTPNTVSAVKKWKFTPFQANGEAVKATAKLVFNFQP